MVCFLSAAKSGVAIGTRSLAAAVPSILPERQPRINPASTPHVAQLRIIMLVFRQASLIVDVLAKASTASLPRCARIHIHRHTHPSIAPIETTPIPAQDRDTTHSP